MSPSQTDRLVPLAGLGRPRRDSAEQRDGALSLLGDRLIHFAEDMLNEDLDARLARMRFHENEAGFDPFGFDPAVARYVLAVSAFLHRWYFRSEVSGLEHLPKGRMLIVANHSGQIPVDGLVIATSLILDAEPPRFPRSMVEKWSAELPFVSVFFARCGQVMGAPENARRLLESDESLIVFPEGVRGIAKTFSRRYQLEDFGLGFMRLALETGTPIVPAAVLGGEEQLISIADIKPLARLLGTPAFPVIPQLLLGMPMPLPVRYRLHFGQPLVFTGDPDDDDAVIHEKVAVVRSTVQSMVNRGLKERRSVFF